MVDIKDNTGKVIFTGSHSDANEFLKKIEEKEKKSFGINVTKISLLAIWLLLWIISGIEHFFYNKDMSVWSGTLLLTLLFLAYNVHKGLKD